MCAQAVRPHPRFIPILGYLDEVLTVPAGILLAVRLIPKPLMAELRHEAEAIDSKPSVKPDWHAIAAIWEATAIHRMGS